MAASLPGGSLGPGSERSLGLQQQQLVIYLDDRRACGCARVLIGGPCARTQGHSPDPSGAFLQQRADCCHLACDVLISCRDLVPPSSKSRCAATLAIRLLAPSCGALPS